MPKAVYKVQEAPNKTRWTVDQNDTPLQSPTGPDGANMQSSHFPTSIPSPRYQSYDGSDYGAPLGRQASMGWKGGQTMSSGDLYEDYAYSPPSDEIHNTNISLNTRVRSPNTDPNDEVGQHLLYETALLDSQSYDIMKIHEVDALKKEHTRLNSRIESAQRKLALESKVKDAAQNLQRLYSINSKNRPDTPQSPQSPRDADVSLRRDSADSFEHTLNQAENELAASIRKVDSLNEIIKGLLERRQMVERKLLKHTAAVLADQTARPNKISGAALSQKRDLEPLEDDNNDYSPDEFDGIRDILVRSGGKSYSGGKVDSQQLSSVQDRLEQLNTQLRNVIDAAASANGRTAEPEMQLNDASDDVMTKLEKRFGRLENNLRNLEHEQQESKAHYQRIEESSFMTRHAVEEQLASLSKTAHNTLLRGSDMQEMQTLREPPQASGNGYQHQLQYLEESLMSMEQILQQHSQEIHSARENNDRAAIHSQKNGEYETTIAGLWDILQSDESAAHDEDEQDAPKNLNEDFSLPAFSARVQNVFDRAQSARTQQDILRRQIQQQRDLNGKSDDEKDRQISELEASHKQVTEAHGTLQEKLTRAMADHEHADNDASQSRSDLMNVMNELDQMKKTVDTKHQEREELSRQLQSHQNYSSQLQSQIDELEAQLEQHGSNSEELAAAHAARETAEQRHAGVQKDMEGLESEVVRLATELTMAKAELDGAYGSRAERAKDAQAAEVDDLSTQLKNAQTELEQLKNDESSRSLTLEQELQEMTAEFQEMTKESIEMEKEREQLDNLIDDLRERCEALEGELSDQKVEGLGAKPAVEGQEAPRETMSTTVIRQEFKKMMRETRAEGIKLLRAEQEERRKLEAELKKLRPASTTLTPRVSSLNHGGSVPVAAPIAA